MEPTTLIHLLQEGGIIQKENGLIMTARPSWIVPGEERLSYTTLVRLIECCREYHWKNDIATVAGISDADTIVKSIHAEFKKPIKVDTLFSITYRVNNVQRCGYLLQFRITSPKKDDLYADCDVVCVFYSSSESKAIPPPAPVANRLQELRNRHK